MLIFTKICPRPQGSDNYVILKLTPLPRLKPESVAQKARFSMLMRAQQVSCILDQFETPPNFKGPF